MSQATVCTASGQCARLPVCLGQGGRNYQGVWFPECVAQVCSQPVSRVQAPGSLLMRPQGLSLIWPEPIHGLILLRKEDSGSLGKQMVSGLPFCRDTCL